MTWNQFMKIFEFTQIPTNGQQTPSHQVYHMQLQVLQDIQQLLNQLEQDILINLHKEIGEISAKQPGTENEQLSQLVQLNTEHFYLYRPLALMLQMNIEELLKFQEIFPTLEPMQLMLLIRLVEIGCYTCYDYFFLFNPSSSEESQYVSDMTDKSQVTSVAVETNDFNEEELQDSPLKLDIVDQPPEKCVYKRNIKPNPTISIVGDMSHNDGNLYVVPVLVRCDNFVCEPKHLTGNDPVKVGVNRTISFKKLKILVTSRQLNETHFGVRFELRKYSSNMDEYNILHQVTSNPICVFSHSTQLKPTPKTKPTISEIIPPRGPQNGQIRIAILGTNFVDSPTTRVRFDNVEVLPIFHGAKTLICCTPKNLSGTVKIQVCNEPNRWSNAGTFTFESFPEEEIMIGNDFNISNTVTG